MHKRRPQQQRRQQVGGLVTVAPVSRTTTTTKTVAPLPGADALTTVTTEVTTKVTTTTRKETARDQVAALCAGLHPRCGAACPLVTRVMATNCGMAAADATLAVRLVWEWIRENSRFYCVTLECYDEPHCFPPLMVTFGVSMLLMTLTHDMRWWAERSDEILLGASLHHLVVYDGSALLLQDRETGKRIRLLKYPGNDFPDNFATNGRWIVCCNTDLMRMVVAELPMRKNANGCGATTTTTIKRPTVVKLDPRWKVCIPQFVGIINENHVLLCCQDASGYDLFTFFEFTLVDLAETCLSKRLAVLSSTVPRLSDIHPPLHLYGFVGKTYHVFRRKNGGGSNHVFVMRECTSVSVGYCNFAVEEGTGKVGRAFPESRRSTKRVSQVNQSQFCVMDDYSDSDSGCSDEFCYSVWDVNNTGKPVRKRQCLSGCPTSQAFVEGGLLFQISQAARYVRKEIHVTDESTGAHVITLELPRESFDPNSHQLIRINAVLVVILPFRRASCGRDAPVYTLPMWGCVVSTIDTYYRHPRCVSYEPTDSLVASLGVKNPVLPSTKAL
ncbi:hypothetical protein Pelo_7019 [Pelomyxa schiedti]|nr:hypothetical protein Pelo_7019 [Pelomyxa schiedti]